MKTDQEDRENGNPLAGIILATAISLAIWAIIGWLAWCCIGCAAPSDYRKIGFRDMQQAFAMMEPAPELNETIHLKDVTVRIVGDRSRFDWAKASASPTILGYARRTNEIWVLGARAGGKIVINQAVLGHELNHLLNFANGRVIDPDLME